MTIEQRATALRERLEADAREQLWGTVAYPAVEAVIAEAIREAVLAEREACAQLVRDAGSRPMTFRGREVTAVDGYAAKLAIAIRSRP